MLRGRCECGATAYEVEDAFDYAFSCHCSNCRAATGSLFKPTGGIPAEKLRVLQGEDALFTWGDANGRHVRCGVCGSLLYSDVGDRVHVALGSLRDEPSRKPEAHIFVDSKAPWEEILDDLPRHPEY